MMAVRRFFSHIRRHPWFHLQSVLLILVSLFMLGLILFSGGPSNISATALQTPSIDQQRSALLSNPASASPLEKLALTITPTPVEPAVQEQETGGILLAASLVVLVVVGGTLYSIRRRK